MAVVMTCRCLVVTAALVVLRAASAPHVEAGQRPAIVDDQRIDRVERWLGALLTHEPGAADEPAATVASWQGEDLQSLGLDVNALVRVMRNPGTMRFSWQSEGDPKPQEIRYTPAQLARLRVLACAASGTVKEPACEAALRQRALGADLLELAIRVADARADDADNFVLRRGALLHTDIAILRPQPPEPRPAVRWSPGQSGYRITMQDGRQTAILQGDDHWEIARGLLGYVRPSNGGRPAPERDDMVRRWYRATAMWMQDSGDHDTKHLDRAREIFPEDPDILFLSGAQHETYASAQVQSVREGAVLPAGVTLLIGPEARELRQAETYFRRSLEANPAQPEAHLRLGHVLAQLNRHEDAARELRTAVQSTDEGLLLYYGSLFLGGSLEALARYDEAQAAYERASALYPTAQSPHLALSELARRRGDRAAALRAVQQVFDLPWSQFQRYDPWWDYDVAQARHVGDLLEDVRRPFLAAGHR
jgi:tetratricopeptide (TPR) repeat protein